MGDAIVTAPKSFTDLMYGRPIYGAPAPLPCPFCGGSPAIDHVSPADLENVDVFLAQCDDCLAQGPGQDTQIEAAEAWNRRANVQDGAAY